jgi:hypothetical protein
MVGLVVGQMANGAQLRAARELIQATGGSVRILQTEPGGQSSDPVVSRRLIDQVIGVGVEAGSLYKVTASTPFRSSSGMMSEGPNGRAIAVSSALIHSCGVWRSSQRWMWLSTFTMTAAAPDLLGDRVRLAAG